MRKLGGLGIGMFIVNILVVAALSRDATEYRNFLDEGKLINDEYSEYTTLVTRLKISAEDLEATTGIVEISQRQQDAYNIEIGYQINGLNNTYFGVNSLRESGQVSGIMYYTLNLDQYDIPNKDLDFISLGDLDQVVSTMLPVTFSFATADGNENKTSIFVNFQNQISKSILTYNSHTGVDDTLIYLPQITYEDKTSGYTFAYSGAISDEIRLVDVTNSDNILILSNESNYDLYNIIRELDSFAQAPLRENLELIKSKMRQWGAESERLERTTD